MRKLLLAIFFLVFIASANAWDNKGHRLIAQIAYDNLKPLVKQKIDYLTQILDPNYPPRQRFLYDSTWLDQIKFKGINSYNKWHFIDFAFSNDHTKLVPQDQINILWALQNCQNILTDPNYNNYQKAQALRFLVHLVGDIHQPLHCADRFSADHPSGDQGGNLFLIKNEDVPNLHAFWDEELDLFANIRPRAQDIENAYPENYFKDKVYDLDLNDWANESFGIAKNFAYNLKEGSEPNAEYIKNGRQIAEQQIALAGYRLAEMLNDILSSV